MKVGFLFDRREPEFYRSGYALDDNCIDAEVAVPESVEKAVLKVQDIFGNTGKTPQCYLDDVGHGGDVGIIFYDNLFERLSLDDRSNQGNGKDFTPWEVKARISIGPTSEYFKKEQVIEIVITGMEIL